MAADGVPLWNTQNKLSVKKKRLGEIAKAIALSAQGVGGRNGNNFRLGAVVCNGSRIIGASSNSYRTHTLLSRFYPWPHIHAEAGAILRVGMDRCYHSDLYVARVTRDDQLALARPCEYCLELIKFARIRNVYYSVRNGYERLRMVEKT
jgi:tRNA(Arg) A34 adenosine deaminase TadA